MKTAVVKDDRYEPAINRVFEDFANHYNTTILPARVRKPKDKSLVESAVRDVYRHIMAPMRNRIFYSLGERSEERRVGKECRCSWWRIQFNKNIHCVHCMHFYYC